MVEYSSVAEAELTVVAMETSKCLLQLKFCAPTAETAAELFNRLQASKVCGVGGGNIYFSCYFQLYLSSDYI